MATAPEQLPDDVDALKAALVEAHAELSEAHAKLSARLVRFPERIGARRAARLADALDGSER